MPPSDIVRVISASRSDLLKDNLVPRMHMMDDRTAAKDSLHLSQLITTENGRSLFPGEHVRQPFVEGCGFPSHPPSGGEYERSEDTTLHITDTLAVSPFLDVLMFLVGRR